MKKKIYPVTSNPWIDNKLRLVELASYRLSQPYILQRVDEGRMSRKTKGEYRTHVRPVVCSVISKVLLQNVFEEVPDVHSN